MNMGTGVHFERQEGCGQGSFPIRFQESLTCLASSGDMETFPLIQVFEHILQMRPFIRLRFEKLDAELAILHPAHSRLFDLNPYRALIQV